MEWFEVIVIVLIYIIKILRWKNEYLKKCGWGPPASAEII